MPSYTQGDVHVNRPLTNISIALFQNPNQFVASKVFPSIPVLKQSDRYFSIPSGDFNRNEARLRAPGTEVARGSYTIDNTPTYFANVYAYGHDIPDQVRANADSPLNLDRQATVFVTHKALIQREAQFVTNYMTSGVWTTTITGVASSPSSNQVIKWSDYTNSDPVSDVQAGITAVLQRTSRKPNTLVLGYEVYASLRNHPDIIDRVKYSGGVGVNNPAIVTLQALATVFGIDRVLVSEAVVNNAAEGATTSNAFIAGKKALLCYSEPNPGILTASAGYTFEWTGLFGAGVNGNRIKKYYIDEIASDRIEIEFAYDMKLISADLGYLFDAIVA